MNTYLIALIAINLILLPLAMKQAAQMWNFRNKSVIIAEVEYRKDAGLAINLSIGAKGDVRSVAVTRHLYDKLNDFGSALNGEKVVDIVNDYIFKKEHERDEEV